MRDGDPPRLLEDPSVPGDVRSALSQAARHTPPVDTAAGLAKLEAAMHAPAAAGVGGGTVALAVAAAVAIGGAVWTVTRPTEAPPPPPTTFDAAPDPAVAEPAHDEPEPELAVVAAARDGEAAAPGGQAVAPGGQAVAPDGEAAPEPVPDPAARSTQSRRRLEPRAGEPAGDDGALARDMAQLAAARRALGADPARALALVEAGRRDFPESIFGEEREALRVLALAGLDRDAEARRLGAAFLAAHPSSPFAERVRRAIEPSP